MVFINLLILPVVVSEAVGRCMKRVFSGVWDHILYCGWNILLCLWSGQVLTDVIRSLLLIDIQNVSVLYSLLMALSYSVICFLANLVLKNVSLKVEFDHEKE